VLFTALAFGKPLLLSDAGGFPEIAAARIVPAGDAAALHSALEQLLGDPAERERLGAAARAAAEGEYSWERVAARTLELYGELIGDNPRP
jgi:glycosyltransferase involved in cell wall biosynthesis